MYSIADRLRQLADELDGGGSGMGVGGGRPGMVRVTPTGVLAHGVERWYPAAEEGESLFTYASRIGPMIDFGTGKPYIPVWLQGSAMFSPTMGPPPPYPGATVPERFDAVMHGRDWMTQADIERQHNLDSTGEHFSPGR